MKLPCSLKTDWRLQIFSSGGFLVSKRDDWSYYSSKCGSFFAGSRINVPNHFVLTRPDDCYCDEAVSFVKQNLTTFDLERIEKVVKILRRIQDVSD